MRIFLKFSIFILLSPLVSCGQTDRKTFLGDRENNIELVNTFLFTDTRFVLSKKNVEIQVSKPLPIFKVLGVDKPWEAAGVDFSTIIKEKDAYRMYYQCHDQNGKRIWCLAYSKDGLVWEKPVLGIVTYNGSTQNNIVSMDIFEVGNLFKRYKDGRSQFVTLAMKSDFKHYFYVSDDGVHFNYEPAPVMPFCADAQNQIIYDQNKNKYVWYLRSWYYSPLLKQYYRTVSYYDSENPSEMQLSKLKASAADLMYRWGKNMPPAINAELKRSMILDYSTTKNKDKDIYTSAVMPYGKSYFAFPAIYMQFRDSKIENDGVLNIHIYNSNNGIDWKDLGVYVDKVVFPGYSQYYMMDGAVIKEDKIYNYMLVEMSTHGVWRTKSGIYAVPQTVNRYASLSSSNTAPAEIVTNGIKVDYNHLFLNFKTTRDGFVQVQLLNKAGRVINQTGKITGDFVDKQIKWSSPLSQGDGNETNKIKFILSKASVFALTHK